MTPAKIVEELNRRFESGHPSDDPEEAERVMEAADLDHSRTVSMREFRAAAEKQFVAGDFGFAMSVMQGPGSESVITCDAVECVLISLDTHDDPGVERAGLELLSSGAC